MNDKSDISVSFFSPEFSFLATKKLFCCSPPIFQKVAKIWRSKSQLGWSEFRDSSLKARALKKALNALGAANHWAEVCELLKGSKLVWQQNSARWKLGIGFRLVRLAIKFCSNWTKGHKECYHLLSSSLYLSTSYSRKYICNNFFYIHCKL